MGGGSYGAECTLRTVKVVIGDNRVKFDRITYVEIEEASSATAEDMPEVTQKHSEKGGHANTSTFVRQATTLWSNRVISVGLSAIRLVPFHIIEVEGSCSVRVGLGVYNR